MNDDTPGSRAARGIVIGILAVLAAFGAGIAAGYALDRGPADSSMSVVGAGDGVESGTADPTFVGTDSPGGALFRRTTAAGISVRAFRMSIDVDETCEPVGAEGCATPVCAPAEFVEVHLVGEWSVVQGGAGLFDIVSGHLQELGSVYSWNDREPMAGIVIRTAPDVSLARISVAGHSDEMEPVAGIAVLALPIAGTEAGGWDPLAGATLEAVVAGETVVVDSALVRSGIPACAAVPPAPPALPEAGEQPADRSAAEAAVVAAFVAVFPGDDSGEMGPVDDPSGLAAIREDLRARYPEMLGGRITYEITDVTFTSPTTAAYYFRPIIADYTEMPVQIGGARLIDGAWLIARDTVCSMFRLGGGVDC